MGERALVDYYIRQFKKKTGTGYIRPPNIRLSSFAQGLGYIRPGGKGYIRPGTKGGIAGLALLATSILAPLAVDLVRTGVKAIAKKRKGKGKSLRPIPPIVVNLKKLPKILEKMTPTIRTLDQEILKTTAGGNFWKKTWSGLKKVGPPILKKSLDIGLPLAIKLTEAYIKSKMGSGTGALITKEMMNKLKKSDSPVVWGDMLEGPIRTLVKRYFKEHEAKILKKIQKQSQKLLAKKVKFTGLEQKAKGRRPTTFEQLSVKEAFRKGFDMAAAGLTEKEQVILEHLREHERERTEREGAPPRYEGISIADLREQIRRLREQEPRTREMFERYPPTGPQPVPSMMFGEVETEPLVRRRRAAPSAEAREFVPSAEEPLSPAVMDELRQRLQGLMTGSGIPVWMARTGRKLFKVMDRLRRDEKVQALAKEGVNKLSKFIDTRLTNIITKVPSAPLRKILEEAQPSISKAATDVAHDVATKALPGLTWKEDSGEPAGGQEYEFKIKKKCGDGKKKKRLMKKRFDFNL